MTGSLPVGARVRVRVPATSANIGPGFDALGLALGLYDEVEATVVPSGLTVEVAGEGATSVPRDGNHLVVRSFRATLEVLGADLPGLVLRSVNRIPHGRGLGSSAAAIVAGIVAARALAPEGDKLLDEAATLRLASELEGHPDNVAACLLGGLVVAWTDQAGARGVRLEPAPVETVVFVPGEALSTKVARGLLPPTVPHADAAANAGRAALLVAALTGAAGDDVDVDVLLAATEDRLHQPYRAPAMAASAALVAELRASGIPAVVSGAGPTVLAFTRVGESGGLPKRAPQGFAAMVLPVDRAGAQVLAVDR
jgi:homoserine kinase